MLETFQYAIENLLYVLNNYFKKSTCYMSKILNNILLFFVLFLKEKKTNNSIAKGILNTILQRANSTSIK